MKDERFMALALEMAQKAAELGEVPVGAVIEKGGELIAAACNTRESQGDPLGHAELNAIAAAAQKLGDWRLSGCTLYVTLEPCCMCAGAILNSRLERVVYAAADADAGCLGSVINMAHLPFARPLKITSLVCQEESRALLQKFFEKMREK